MKAVNKVENRIKKQKMVLVKEDKPQLWVGPTGLPWWLRG